MWFVYILAVSILSKSVISFTPLCGLNCILLTNSTGDTASYIVNGSPVTIHQNGTQLDLNCNNNYIDYNYLPKYEKNVEISYILFNNCTFTAMTIKFINNYMNIFSDSMILEEWKPKELDNFTNIKGLRTLKINKSNITKILPNLITDIEDLTEFHFTNGIVTINENIKLPPNLKLLNLTNNNIDNLVELIQNTRVLEIIVLNKNSLKTMPKLYRNNLVKVLDVSFNNLSEIEKDFIVNLTCLELLFMNNNNISKLETGMFVGLSNITELHLQYNFIETLPKMIFNDLSGLRVLNISHNRLHEVQVFAFPGNSGKLRTLDLSYNQLHLTSLCSDSSGSRLNGLSKLSYLNISHNKLQTLCSSWEFLDNLRNLDLSYNQIENITHEDFVFTRPDITVDYRHNGMVSILYHEEDLKNNYNYKMRKYYLSDNNFICDGFLSHFIKAAKDNNLFANNVEDTKCALPTQLENHTFSSLEYHKMFLAIGCAIFHSNLTNCTCDFYVIDRQMNVNCSGISDPPIQAFVTSNKIHKVALILEHCNLNSVPKYFPKNLTELHLAHNNISDVPKMPNQLVHLDLSYNNLSYLSEEAWRELVAPHLNRTVRLSGNRMPCDCRNDDFLSNLIDYSDLVLDMNAVRCASGAELKKNPLCGRRGWVLVILCTLGILFAVCAALCAVYYKYRLGIKATLYTYGYFLPFLYIEDLEKEKQYDAFVSYAHKDEPFVTDELIPRLEGQLNYRLCIHDRDWPIGPDIPSQILNSVEDSRRTIVILSKNFLKSVWSIAEFRAGVAENYRTGSLRVIIVKLQDAGDLTNIEDELITYIKSNTFIERSDPFFWQKLCFALPHKRYNKKPPEPIPLSKSEEKKRLKRVQPIAEFVDKEFAKLDSKDESIQLADEVEIKVSDNVCNNNKVQLIKPDIS